MPESPYQFDLVVHATHEAGVKVGGIGAVFDGLLSTRAYGEHVGRTVLVGPMTTSDKVEMERLTAPRNQLRVIYSSYHSIDRAVSTLRGRLRAIERQHHVRLLYGTRAFGTARHEIILVDGSQASPSRLNAFKSGLYRHFGIRSDLYESHPEYSLHVNAAEPAYRALQAVVNGTRGRRFIIAHEFMGLPLCYCAIMRDPGTYHTVFYGHEVATVRPIVESHPGHDTMFYSVLAQAQQEGQFLEDVFGDQSHFFKHGLIRPAASYCDNIFAVGDFVVQEMRFLDANWKRANIDLVYNGVPSHEIGLEEKRVSRSRLQEYCTNLLGYRPDHVFTHVTRFIPSKGLWRDIRVMEALAPLLERQGKSAVLFILSSIIPVGRPPEVILQMEAQYGWPVNHRDVPIQVDGQDVPDLVSHEIPFYRAIEQFNQVAGNAQIVLVNQFGWSQDRCGKRMPQEMSFIDIRQGSDLEFGQSVYEPFGIAQVEPLSFGALCVISSVCGCLGFIRQVGGLDKPNVIVADYTMTGRLGEGLDTALSIDQKRRDQIEAVQAELVAAQISDRLPQDDSAAHSILKEGYALSKQMSWEVVARDYLIPGLTRAAQQARPPATVRQDSC